MGDSSIYSELSVVTLTPATAEAALNHVSTEESASHVPRSPATVNKEGANGCVVASPPPPSTTSSSYQRTDLSPKSIRFSTDVALIEIDSTSTIGATPVQDAAPRVASPASGYATPVFEPDRRYRVASESDTGRPSFVCLCVCLFVSVFALAIIPE